MKSSGQTQIPTFIKLLLVIVAFLGIIDASYITYEELRGIIPPCTPPFACDTVLQSKWSHIGPVPLSVLGMFYYATVFAFAVLHFLGIREVVFPKRVFIHITSFLRFLTTLGLFFSMYLVFLMAIILNAWCLYCLFSATFCVLLFGISQWIFRKEQQQNKSIPSLKRNMFRALYQWIAKPFFFLLDAEFVHNQMTMAGKLLGSTRLTQMLTASLFSVSDPRLSKTIDGITFPNPIGLSAGFDYDAQLTQVLPSVGFGFATVGTVTQNPYEGNTTPRLGRFPRSKALLVNKGFKSAGATEVIGRLEEKTFGGPIGISIGSTNMMHETFADQIADIMQTFRQFESSQVKHSYYELNISCPNTKGGQPFTTPHRLGQLLVALDKLKIKKPVYLKMPIDLGMENTLSLLETADRHSVAGVIFGNLTKDKTNPDVHPEDRKQWEIKMGNLSGKPTFHRSNYYIKLTKETFKDRFTIIGTGGVFTPEDARLKFMLGADLVQLITGMIYEGPQLIGEINQSLLVATRKKIVQ